MAYIGSALALAVAVYTALIAGAEWQRGNRFGGVGLVVLGLATLALGVMVSFQR